MKFFSVLLVIAVIAVASEIITAEYLLVDIKKGNFALFTDKIKVLPGNKYNLNKNFNTNCLFM